MLFLIAGGTGEKRAVLRRKASRAAFEELDQTTTGDELAMLAGTPTLTGESRAFFLRGVLGSKDESEGSLKEYVLELAEGLASSVHVFVFDEEKVPTKPMLRVFEKADASIELLESPEKKESFNVFALADAMGKGDRKQTWLLLLRALRGGAAPEQIAGMLAWKARTMLASAGYESERVRLRKLSRDIVVMYHDSHRGAGELGLLLERFVLTL